MGLEGWLAVAASATVYGVAWLILRPWRQLGVRVRPYSAAPQARLTQSVDVWAVTRRGITGARGVVAELVGPLAERWRRIFARIVGGEATAATQLQQAGLWPELTSDQRVARFRSLMLGAAVAGAVGSGGFAALVGTLGWWTPTPAVLVVVAAAGALFGVWWLRKWVADRVALRSFAMRTELYSINQILALRSRAGGGATAAINYVVSRTHGAVSADLAAALDEHHDGRPLSDALRDLAERTPEPQAARVYRTLATSQTRGVDLAASLLAVGKDLRAARRDEVLRHTQKRRAALGVALIFLLGPLAILFVVAPMTRLILGL